MKAARTIVSIQLRAASVARMTFAFVLSLFCTTAGACESDEVGWFPDNHGVKRKYLLHIPPDCTRDQLPLVVVLHGGGQSGRLVRYVTSMNEVADKEKFAVLYPDGSGRYKRFLLTWNAGDCCGYSSHRRVDDVAFVDSVIDGLLSRGIFDRNRIYLAGYSNGAMMAYKAGCEKPERFAAIASIGGSMTGREHLPEIPLSVMIIHGTADKHVPYTGGAGKLAKWGYPVNKQSVEFAKSFWIKANGCTQKSLDQQNGVVKLERFSSERGTAEVELFTINGGRHSWPGGKRLARHGDKPFAGLDASSECWKFFSRHSKENAPQPRLAHPRTDAVVGTVKEHREERGG